MKNLSLVLNVVLLLAVGFLFYYNFSGKKGGGGKMNSGKGTDSVCRNRFTMAYFNIDSVDNSFEYYKQKKKEFEDLQTKEDNDLKAMQKRFGDQLMKLQQQALSPAQQEEARKKVEDMQQQMQQAKSDAEGRLYNSSTSMSEDVRMKINDFLKKFNTPQKYDYIMEYSPQLMFYKDSTLDITSDLVKGLNEMYKKKDK